jgi:uncharacterized repeat protein (TIGR03803 family)
VVRAFLIPSALCVAVAACSSAAVPTRLLPADTSEPSIHVNASGYKTFFSFDGADGSFPVTALLDVKGEFYGTTESGGNWSTGGGTAFAIDANGKESVLHSFGRGTDGAQPRGSLIAVNGTLYGTTTEGGKYRGGTVFSLTPSGAEHVLHSFGNRKDGKEPEAGLTLMNGTLYGTTYAGGKFGEGTVFSITTSGEERVTYNFKPSGGDGSKPSGGLMVFKGLLYGTTFTGGCENGTVFSVTAEGQEKIVYTFKCSSSIDDGENPAGALIAVKNTLYGTTFEGGSGSEIDGTVFSLSPAGKERILHSFGASGDGMDPVCSLLFLNGLLYGVTPDGGTYNKGIVFSMSTSGREAILHDFGALPDGEGPQGALINVDGKLFGTAANGGKYPYGEGTIFTLSP